MIFFHEDYYCQQEILPLAALEFCLEEIEKIKDFSVAHRASDGLGWTAIYKINNPPQRLSELGITLNTFGAVMTAELPEVRAIYSGNGPGFFSRTRCRRTRGYGFNCTAVIYADWNRDKIIEHILVWYNHG